MNLQMVSGEIDATTGEAINTDDLTKYEKAVNALGVSLKTVENGAIKLRDPIEILKELSEAYRQLDIDDSRRTNLISAVGGKYRGNQLNALLENWDTYEKMLQDYANGTNSAAEEAEKSANSWEGSLNKFKNSVTDLTNNFVTSGRAKGFIDFFTGIIKYADRMTTSLGSLGSAVTLFSMIMISKSKTLHFNFDKDTQSIRFGTTALRDMTAATAAQSAKNLVLTATTKLANAAISIGASLIIGGMVSAISSWINKDEELAQKQEEEIQKLKEKNQQYKENTKNIEDNIATYKKLMEQDSLSESDKQQLLDIQNQIIDTYGQQAEGIDLVNGKLKEQLGILYDIADIDYQKNFQTAIDLIKKAGEKAEQETSDNILSLMTTDDNNIFVLTADGQTVGGADTTFYEDYFGELGAARHYLNILKDIKGFVSEIDELSFINTYDWEEIIKLDDALSYGEKITAITEALHRLNTETSAEAKNDLPYQYLTQKLQDLLSVYEEYVKEIQDSSETLIKGLSPSDIGTNINWRNVTDETFKQWYDAIMSYYSTDRWDKDYQDAVIDWFDRNYTSIAQRMARGTTIADIAYESEQAYKKKFASDTGVFGFSFSAYQEDIDTVTKEMKNLKSVIDKIDSGKYSAIEDGFGLAESYPELLRYINDTDTLREKLVELRNASPDNLISDLQTVRKNLEQVGNYKQIAQIDALIEALRTLGDTAEETAEQLTAKDYLQIQQDGIDKIVDKLNEEKEAMNEVLDSLNDRKSEIEDYYDAQIDALKTENEERERNIELQEKQKALDDAKRNKVRVYSAAKGFTIQEDSEAVAKAQDELDKAINDNKIDELEDQKDKAISVIEEQIKAQKKDIKSKEDEIQEWKDYKTQLTDEHNAIVETNSAYLEAQKQFVLDENSTFLDREQNLKDHLARMKALIDGEDEGTGDNSLYTDAFGVAPQAAINAILAMNGLLETNPLPQGSTSKSKVSGISSSLLSTGSPIILTDATKSVTTPIAPSSEQTKTFAPTLNISAEKVDEKAIKSWWDRQIVEEYNKFLVAN